MISQSAPSPDLQSFASPQIREPYPHTCQECHNIAMPTTTFPDAATMTFPETGDPSNSAKVGAAHSSSLACGMFACPRFADFVLVR